MSDYFLNKIYDSLLVNKTPKTKSTFRTLSESYGLVYEDENTETANQAAELSNISVQNNQQQIKSSDKPSINNEPQSEQPKIPIINVKEPIYPQVKWSEALYDLYDMTTGRKVGGVGPGEYAVASVISGYTDSKDCAQLVSGPQESYDVSFPSRETPTFKFEVKGIEGDGSVPIAKHGTKIKNEIVKKVTNILEDIINIYSILDEGQKQAINEYILSYVENPDLIEWTKEDQEIYDKLRAKTQKSGTPRTEKEKEQYNELIKKKNISATTAQIKSAAEIEGLKGIWTVERWAQGILNDIGEIPFKNVLFDPSPGGREKYPEIRRVGHLDEIGTSTEETRLIFTVKQFIDFINNVELNEKEIAEPEETQTKINTLSKTFKQFYGDSSSPELNNKLDDEAIKVNRHLNKIKIDTLKTGYVNFTHFVRDIKKLNLKNRINELENFIYNTPSTITSLFPDKLTGLFVVSKEGYHYFPKEQLPKYIMLTQITRDALKIKVKAQV